MTRHLHGSRSQDAVCILLLATCLMLGCQSADKDGPLYKLRLPDVPPPVVPVAVSVTDKRPEQEKQYRRGAVEPANYQDGIERLTLVNFEPQILDAIKTLFAQRLSTLKDPPTWADVEIVRFRTLIDRREVLAAAYERELLQGAPGMSVGVGMGSGGHSGAGSLVGGAAASLMAAAATSQKLRVIDNDRTSWDHAMSGITCEIEMDVTLHYQNQTQTRFHLEARAHSMPQDDDEGNTLFASRNWNVAPTVVQALEQLGEKIQAEAVLARNGARTREPAASDSVDDGINAASTAERLPESFPERLPADSPGNLPESLTGETLSVPGELPADAGHLNPFEEEEVEPLPSVPGFDATSPSGSAKL